MKLTRIGGTQIECSAFLIAAVFVWIILGAWKSVLCCFFALLIHEGGHLYTAKSLGCRVGTITLHPFGFSIRLNDRMGLWDELCMAAAGPLCSLLAGVSCLALESLHLSTPLLHTFGAANMSIGLMNLLPAYPLDGGRVLRACLLHDTDAAPRLYAYIGLALSVLLCIFGFLLLLRDNPSFFFMSVFLLLAAVQELRSNGHSRAYAMLTHASHIQSGVSLRVRHIAVEEHTPIKEAYAMSSERYYTVWEIVDAKMRICGSVDEGVLLQALALVDAQTPISSLVDRIP